MATRPTPRSRDGTRPRSTSGTRPTSSPRPCSSDASSSRAGARASPSPPASDKPVPSFLRPTVSSSLRDSSSSSTPTPFSSSSKARAVTPKRPSTADKAPARPTADHAEAVPRAECAPAVGHAEAVTRAERAPRSVTPNRTPAQNAPRPITPKRTPAQSAPRPVTPKRSPAQQQQQVQGAPPQIIAPMDKAKAKASTSRWSVVSPRQLMQKASNAFKVGKSRSKKNKDLAGPAVAAAASASGKDAADVTETEAAARAMPVEEQQRHPAPETTPLDVQQEEVVVEPNAAQSAREEATSQEVVSTEIQPEEQRGRDEQVSAGDAEKANAVHDEKVVMEESEASEVDKPVPGEKPQAGNVEETAKEAETNTEDELPAAAVVDAAGKESSTLPRGQESELETKAENRRQQEEESPKQEEVKGNSETSTISEEPKEQAEYAGESKLTAASRATSMPATSLEEALLEMDTPTNAAITSRSEPVTPAKEPVSKDKSVIDTLLSASASTTPLRGGTSSSMAKIPEEAVRLTFRGSKVKTALEKRPEEAQPKKKEVARSNDVLEETKSKLLEKRKSKVKALVGAFEVVMDSPRASTPGKSPRPGDW